MMMQTTLLELVPQWERENVISWAQVCSIRSIFRGYHSEHHHQLDAVVHFKYLHSQSISRFIITQVDPIHTEEYSVYVPLDLNPYD